MEDIEERLRGLEQRVQVLDIFQLEGEYCRAWDFGSGQEWAELFLPDGIFEIPAASNVAPLPGNNPVQIEGRQALADFHAAFANGWQMLHQMHLPSCRIKEDEAETLIFFECPVKASDTDGRAMLSREIGIYQVNYRKTFEGWKIAKRIEHPIFRDALYHFGRPQLD